MKIILNEIYTERQLDTHIRKRQALSFGHHVNMNMECTVTMENLNGMRGRRRPRNRNILIRTFLLFILKLPSLAWWVPENRMHGVLVKVTCYVCAFQRDTSDFIKWVLSHTLLSEMISVWQLASNMSMLHIKARTTGEHSFQQTCGIHLFQKWLAIHETYSV